MVSCMVLGSESEAASAIVFVLSCKCRGTRQVAFEVLFSTGMDRLSRQKRANPTF